MEGGEEGEEGGGRMEGQLKLCCVLKSLRENLSVRKVSLAAGFLMCFDVTELQRLKTTQSPEENLKYMTFVCFISIISMILKRSSI